jgi:hypothetical protein
MAASGGARLKLGLGFKLSINTAEEPGYSWRSVKESLAAGEFNQYR